MAFEIFSSNAPSTIKIDGLSVRYVHDEAGTGVPLLMTAPWPQSIYAFHAIWGAMRKLGPIIAVDLPGFGLSEGREDLMSPATMGRFMIRILDTLSLDRVHVVAPDVGTLASLFAAFVAPERFESIVAGSGGTSLDLLGDSLKSVVHSARADYEGKDGGPQVVAMITAMTRTTPPAEAMEDFRLSSEGQRWNQAADFVRNYQRDLPLLATLLPQIQTPVLAISGSDDPIVPPSNGAFLADRLPHCTAEVLKSSHFVWDDAASDYARLVTDWVSGGYLTV